jgi:UDP-N-acetylmuramoyl-tripeptide--D-alanyl-D-alanine ligase
MVQAARGTLIRGSAEGQFTGVSNDTRTIAPGALYVAIRGQRFDGHRFCREALEKGAGGVLVEAGRARALRLPPRRPVIGVPDTIRALGRIAHKHRRAFDIPVIAITGSNGKTRLGMNHAGEIRDMTRICEPTVGVITNVGPAHVEYFRNVDAIARAKGELYRNIRGGTIVVNADDPRVVRQARGIKGRQITFGTGRGVRVRAERVLQKGIAGQAFTLVVNGKRTRVSLPIPGLHYVMNALAAAAGAHAVGLGPSEMSRGLAAFEQTKWRMEIMQLHRNIILINDCYNANPASMEATLRSFSQMKGEARGIAVLGDMLELGVRSVESHREVGRLVRELGIEVLLTYGTAARAIAEEATNDEAGTEVHVGKSHSQVAAKLRRISRGKDWILVEGSRGMQMERIIERFSG